MNIHKLIISLSSLAFLAGAIPVHAENPPAEYPLTQCVISEEKLGAHGEPFKISDNGTGVYLCCKACRKPFAKDPAKYTQMVKDAAAAKK